MEDASLRLKGRADRIFREGPDAFSVVDFKTGSAMDQEGNVRDAVRTQMVCYGALLARILGRRPSIRLLVDDGAVHEIPFDAASEEPVRDLLARLHGLGPPGGELSVAVLATPGNDCRHCSVRHRCTDYLEEAPRWWNELPDNLDQAPLDIWGKIRSVRRTMTYETLDLIDQAGRLARIRGLDLRHGTENWREGDSIFAFGLRARSVPRDRNNRILHPINFYEVPEDASYPRAWGIKVYGQDCF